MSKLAVCGMCQIVLHRKYCLLAIQEGLQREMGISLRLGGCTCGCNGGTRARASGMMPLSFERQAAGAPG